MKSAKIPKTEAENMLTGGPGIPHTPAFQESCAKEKCLLAFQQSRRYL
jgi:hypothetical protein